MSTHDGKQPENKNQLVSDKTSEIATPGSSFHFLNNRPEAVAQRKLQENANNSLQVSQLRSIQEKANSSPQAKQAARLQAMANRYSSQQNTTIQKQGNMKSSPQASGGTPEVFQLLAKAGDTIELEVKPDEPPRFMRNKAEPGGGEEPKSGEIGGTGILDAGSWGGLGVSPRNFHRAHAISNAFGGGGGADNVAWWSSEKETEWTESEEKVRGGGLDQIEDWKPGDVETGNYTVTRGMKDNVNFKPGYLSRLSSSAAWGLDDSRAAWTRFRDLVGADSEEFKKGASIKAKYLASLGNYFSKKLDDLGYGKAGKNLIDRMNMNYQISNSGNGAGGSRADLSKEVASDDIDAADFGLKNEPQNIWKEMVAANTGLFTGNWLATGNKRVNRPWGGPKSGVPRPAPIELTPQEDGWGIP